MQNDKIAHTDGRVKTEFRNWAMPLMLLTMIPLTFLGLSLRFLAGPGQGNECQGNEEHSQIPKNEILVLRIRQVGDDAQVHRCRVGGNRRPD